MPVKYVFLSAASFFCVKQHVQWYLSIMRNVTTASCDTWQEMWFKIKHTFITELNLSFIYIFCISCFLMHNKNQEVAKSPACYWNKIFIICNLHSFSHMNDERLSLVASNNSEATVDWEIFPVFLFQDFIGHRLFSQS